MAVKSHIAIAAEQGMKAGFNAYMGQLKRSGLPTVQAKLDEMLSLSKRQRFARYCAMVGPDVTAYQTVTIPVVEVEHETPQALASEIAQARARLAELEAQAKAAKPSRTSSKPASKAKENLWRAWAVRKFNIPQTVGSTFEYAGKRRKTTFRVTRVTSEGVYTVRAS